MKIYFNSSLIFNFAATIICTAFFIHNIYEKDYFFVITFFFLAIINGWLFIGNIKDTIKIKKFMDRIEEINRSNK